MDTALEIGKILLVLAFGVGAIAWQVVEYQVKAGWTIIWIGIIPIPVGLFGILCTLASIVMSINLWNATHH